MPLFEYRCTTCGLSLEILQRDGALRASCGEDCVSAGADWGTGSLERKLSVPTPLKGLTSVLGDNAPPPADGCGHCNPADD